MYVMKYTMREYMLSSVADKLGLESKIKDKLREVLASHANYRKFLNPYGVAEDPAKQPDLGWRGGWAQSEIMYLNFIERVVFTEDFDGALRTAAKMGKDVADVMTYDSFASQFGQIMETAKKEKEDVRMAEAAQSGAAAPAAEANQAQGGGQPAAAGGSEGGEGGAAMRLQVEAQRLVHSNVTLFIEPESQTELKNAIMSSNAGKCQGTDGQECPGAHSPPSTRVARQRWLARVARVVSDQCYAGRPVRYVVVVYDYKQAGESKTNPAIRIAPLRDSRCVKCVLATIEARRTTTGGQTSKLVQGDLYFLFDSSCPGNWSKLRAGFVDEEGQPLAKCERKLTLVYSEQGAARRRAYVHGTGSVKQQEGLLMITRHKVKVPRRKRLHFDGTSAGDTFVNIPAVAPDDEWALTLGKKKLLYGPHRVDVGGRGPDSSSDEVDDADAAAAAGDVVEQPPTKAPCS
jgi:hypothetical protein